MLHEPLWDELSGVMAPGENDGDSFKSLALNWGESTKWCGGTSSTAVTSTVGMLGLGVKLGLEVK